VEFEWDADKAAENLRKHKVSFIEAATVFGDFLGTTAADPAHSAEEDRYITLGLSSLGRVRVVAGTYLADRMRAASAGRLTERGKRASEKPQG